MSDNKPDDDTPQFRTALERRDDEDDDDQEDSETDPGGQRSIRGP